MCIYAILAVEFFGKFGAEKCDGASALADTDCWENINGMSIQLVTARGFTYGSEYYGTFFRALYTLFQVMTGESWAEMERFFVTVSCSLELNVTARAA